MYENHTFIAIIFSDKDITWTFIAIRIYFTATNIPLLSISGYGKLCRVVKFNIRKKDLIADQTWQYYYSYLYKYYDNFVYIFVDKCYKCGFKSKVQIKFTVWEYFKRFVWYFTVTSMVLQGIIWFSYFIWIPDLKDLFNINE